MENKSIWGKHWTPFRKVVYPVWLAYETSQRFYDYGESVHNFMEKHQDKISHYVGGIGAQTADIIASVGTFGLFELFLTGLSSTILTLSIISFLGLGIKDFYGITDWGSQISFAKNYLLDYPIMTALPSLGIFLTVSLFNRLRKKITF